eukprot:tig00000786_g4051.t1
MSDEAFWNGLRGGASKPTRSPLPRQESSFSSKAQEAPVSFSSLSAFSSKAQEAQVLAAASPRRPSRRALLNVFVTLREDASGPNYFRTLGDGLAAVNQGGTVYLAPGTYREEAGTLMRSCTVAGMGEASGDVTIEFSGPRALRIDAPTVTFQNLTLRAVPPEGSEHAEVEQCTPELDAPAAAAAPRARPPLGRPRSMSVLPGGVLSGSPTSSLDVPRLSGRSSVSTSSAPGSRRSSLAIASFGSLPPRAPSTEPPLAPPEPSVFTSLPGRLLPRPSPVFQSLGRLPSINVADADSGTPGGLPPLVVPSGSAPGSGSSTPEPPAEATYPWQTGALHVVNGALKLTDVEIACQPDSCCILLDGPGTNASLTACRLRCAESGGSPSGWGVVCNAGASATLERTDFCDLRVGALAAHRGTTTLKACTIHDCEVGSLASDKGRTELRGCTLFNVRGAASMLSQGPGASLAAHKCSVSNSSAGVGARRGAEAAARECEFRFISGDAVFFEERSSGSLQNSIVDQCRRGVRIAESRVEIDGNSLCSVGGSALLVGDGGDIAARGNRLRTAGGGAPGGVGGASWRTPRGPQPAEDQTPARDLIPAVEFAAGSKGLLEANDIHGPLLLHASATPIVMSNTIHYDPSMVAGPPPSSASGAANEGERSSSPPPIDNLRAPPVVEGYRRELRRRSMGGSPVPAGDWRGGASPAPAAAGARPAPAPGVWADAGRSAAIGQINVFRERRPVDPDSV